MKELTSATIRVMSRLGSCGAFGMAAMELPEMDDSLSIVTADLCFYSGLDRFREKYPEHFYNVGIAEQNLVGVAAGLAKEGFTTFASTYASFAVTRALDQVRVNMGYMKLPIKLVGLTSGFSVSVLGATHTCIEDLAIARSIPNMVVLSPADCTETYKAVIAAASYPGPVYLRLTGTMNNPIVYKEEYSYEIGKAIKLRDGEDVAIIATGTMVDRSLKAADILEEQGISCKVIDMHTIKPLDGEMVEEAFQTKLVVTVEEHSIRGGLGSAVAEYMASAEKKAPQMMLGVPDEFTHAASYDYILGKYGLTSEQIAHNICNRIQGH